VVKREESNHGCQRLDDHSADIARHGIDKGHVGMQGEVRMRRVMMIEAVSTVLALCLPKGAGIGKVSMRPFRSLTYYIRSALTLN
jgi:hypothetical protein